MLYGAAELREPKGSRLGAAELCMEATRMKISFENLTIRGYNAKQIVIFT
jgi:hypothetical protein